LLDEAARRPSPVVWLVRAEARTSYLQQVKPDPDLTVRACQDAVMARQALKDSVPALRTSLRTHLVASRVFQKAGVAFDVRRAAALKEAGDDFAALAPFRSNAEVANLRYFFVRETGTPDQALAEARACVAACPNDPVVAGNLAQQLYLHGQYADAAAVPKVTTWVKILATAEPPGSRDQAHALYLATAGPGQPAWETYNGLLVLAAIGYPAEVAERATALLQRPETFPPLRPEQFNRLVRFLADPRADEAAFLADPTFNRGDQSNARLSVGLRQLARGERDRARAEFQKVIDLGVIDFIPYDIATLLHYQLSRPDQPAWPAWAPAKP
jgi:tetratricopeptide (TPR) repeat protein